MKTIPVCVRCLRNFRVSVGIAFLVFSMACSKEGEQLPEFERVPFEGRWKITAATLDAVADPGWSGEILNFSQLKEDSGSYLLSHAAYD